MGVSVQAGHMQSPENLRVIKSYSFQMLHILLHLLMKVRPQKLCPEPLSLLLSVIMLHGLGKMLSTREGARSFATHHYSFHATNLRALRISL